MEIKKIDNLFSSDELLDINETIINSELELDNHLGRVKSVIHFKDLIIEKINKIIIGYDTNLVFSSSSYVEYNNLYGIPELPPHFDGDDCDLLLNYQLSSNTVWGIGLNKEIYNLQDNEAVIFSPNEVIHWRPIKNFLNEEYVKMIFFRFQNLKSPSDNFDKRYSLDHPIYKEINKFRDELSST